MAEPVRFDFSSRRRVLAASAMTLCLVLGLGAAPVSAESNLPRPLISEDGARELSEYTFQEVVGENELREWGFVDLRGRPIVAVAWASWCGVCRKDLPRLEALQAELGDDVLVMAMSIDDGRPEATARVLRKRGLHGLRAFHDTAKMFFMSTGAMGVPSAVIADRDGRIVARAQGSVRWDAPEVLRFVRGLAAPKNTPITAAAPSELADPR